MNIFIIAQVINGKNVVGYRLLDLDSKNQIRDYNIDTIKNVLNNPKTADVIKNAKLVNGEITGTNGQLTRYAKVNTNGSLCGNAPLVVINKIGDVGYTVSDFKGVVKKMKNSDVVEYAKNQGIANGKVVIQDNIEYISSISDSYEQVSLSPSKVGKQSKVNIGIHIDRDAASVAKHTENDIDTELQYNDVFSAMTPEQRAVLKQYYTWYTVDVYKSLAKNVRLQLAPGKAEKLAQLRGIDKWQFAGVNDSYLEGRLDAKCELGHNLRYEYFAIPEELAEGSSARIKDWNNIYAFRTTRGEQTDLRERGAIVFGETCAGDFFNIAPEDMKKLVKTRKTMSDEIELLADIITNHMEDLYINKCRFLYDCIRVMGNAKTVVDVFGQQVGYTLLSFAKVKLPYPKSLVILAGNQIRKNQTLFFNSIIPNHNNTIDIMLNSVDSSIQALRSANNLFDYIVKFTVEGEYQYNPLSDKDCTRRDIGAYNKDTRREREYILRKLYAGTCIDEKDFSSLEILEKYVKLVEISLDVCKEASAYITKSSTLSSYFADKPFHYLVKYLEKFAEDTNKISMDKVVYVDVLTSCLSFSKEYTVTDRFRHRTENILDRYRTSRAYKHISEIESAYDNTIKDDRQLFLLNSLGLFEKSIEDDIKETLEKELNRPRYIKIQLKDDSESLNKMGEKACIKYVNRQEREELEHIVKGEYSEDLEIEVYKGIKIKASDVKSFEEIELYTYTRLKVQIDDILLSEKMLREAKEKEEQARLEEERKKAEEEKIKEEFNNDKKMQKLRSLLDTHPQDDADYGIHVARNILDREIPYNKLSSKQQWRIDETIKQLSNNTDNTVDSNIPTKTKLADSKEVNDKVEKLLEVLSSKDKDACNKVNTASKLAFDIAKTVKYKGEFSEKQLKHINKAYEAIQ